MKIRDIGIYDNGLLVYVVRNAKSYKDAFLRYEKETGKRIPQSGDFSARNYEKTN